MRNGLTPKKPGRGSPVDCREEKPFIIVGAKSEKDKIDATYEAVEVPYDDVTEFFCDRKYYEPSDVLQASGFNSEAETIEFIDQNDNEELPSSEKTPPDESTPPEVQSPEVITAQTPASPGKVPRPLRQVRAQGMLFGETDEPTLTPIPESTVPSVSSSNGEVTVNGCSHTEVPPSLSKPAPVYSEVRKPKSSTSSPQLALKTSDTANEIKSTNECESTRSDNGISPVNIKDPDLSLTSSVSPSEDSTVSSSGIEEDAGSLSSSAPSLPRWWNSRLSLRKNRTVVHKNLEDNYGAVVSANHEALSQILEQISQSKSTLHPVHPLKDAILRWSDFSVIEKALTVIGQKVFCNAVWTSNTSEEFTLMVCKDAIPTAYSGKGPFILPPLVNFHDLIPLQLLDCSTSGRVELTPTQTSSLSDPSGNALRGYVWVFPRMQVMQMEDYTEELQHTFQNDIESFERSICFIMLQLINGLKHLQAEGVEEVDSALEWMVLVRDKKDVNYRVTLIGVGTPGYSPQQSAMVSLCECSLLVLRMLFSKKTTANSCSSNDELNIPDSLPSKHAFQVVADIFQKEKATSLSKAKAILEYMLWGPVELSLDSTHSHETALQRWLDLERATVLNNLIRSQGLWQIELTVLEEYHLLFLVRTTSRMLREAAAMIATESTNV